jgi:subtilisin-like proprotein convertase family protein
VTTEGAPYPSIINVTRYDGRLLTSLRLTLFQFAHSFPEDVDILLEAPTGDKIILLSDAGGHTAVRELNLTFDTSATAIVGTNTLQYGSYLPGNYGSEPDPFPAPAPFPPYHSDLAALLDKPANGEWKLFVVDDESSDAGTILGGWSLEIDTEELAMHLNRDENSTLRLNISGNVGTRVAVESSTDLLTWTELQRIFVGPWGSTSFEIAPTEPHRKFLRARKVRLDY